MNTEPINHATGKFILKQEQLPEYEQDLNHASLIEQQTEEFYHKGMITYRTVCFNCHGNVEQPGSMPNATKFWKDEFKNGADPYAMYQTLTRGFGLMAPQVRLSPKEKYDVINFIREEYMKEQNPDQYITIDSSYLSSLPEGDTLGPEPQTYQPWAEMDYGNFYIHTYDFANSNDPPRKRNHRGSPIPNEDLSDRNFAYKGIAMRLDKGKGGIAAGNTFALFDHDLLRFTGFWTGEGFVDYRSILMNDEHNIYPRTVGEKQVENPMTPGWANPATGSFEDPRFEAVDGRKFGPLPKAWAHYKGLYHYGNKVIITYEIGDATVHELYELEQVGEAPIVSRTLNVSSSPVPLTMRILPEKYAVQVIGGLSAIEDGFHVLKIPANSESKVKILMAAKGAESLKLLAEKLPNAFDLSVYTKGGPSRYKDQVLSSPIIKGEEHGAYAEDVFVLPQVNPWNSRMRPSGIDFLAGGEEAVVTTIDGEVWRLEGILQTEGVIKWHRIATGLFQPLGVKYIDGDIYVGCRDAIYVLRDLNGNGETDFYESFNSDHQVTEHFHEFAMGLQADKDGNFYYAKSARHARDCLVPQHGTLLKVTSDGSSTEIIAKGFRAANGVCINPDGSFFVTDQEGHWNPMNRINRVTEGGFYGNMYGYGAPKDSTDAAMIHPLVWVDMKYDRSPAELVWADSDKWGPLNGALLNISYGYGKVYVILPQTIGEHLQGGMVELPVPQFPTGLMRARFNPKDGQFYGCGMSAWATSQMIQVGGLYRIRYTGKPLHLPTSMKATKAGITITFSESLDRSVASNPENYTVNTWELKRTRRYGSKRYNEQSLQIEQVDLTKDGKTINLQMPTISTTWVMEILYDLKSQTGAPLKGAIQNSIYELEEGVI